MHVQIFIPTFNRAKKLRRAVESVLAQTVREVEVVILDNHSEDETPAVVADLARADPRVTYVRREENIGMVPNFNAIRGLVSGTHFTVLSDDDDYEPGFLATALDGFRRHPSVQFVACNALTKRGAVVVKSQLDTWRGGFYRAGSAVRRCLLGHYPLVTNCLFSAQVREDFYFQPDLANVSDGFLLTCMFAKYDAFVTKEVTGHWYNDGENTSSILTFEPVRMVNTVLCEYALYAQFTRQHRLVAGGMAMLWFKKFFTVLVAADRSDIDTVLHKTALREQSSATFAGLVRMAHAVRLVRAFMGALRLFRRLNVAMVSRAHATAPQGERENP